MSNKQLTNRGKQPDTSRASARISTSIQFSTEKYSQYKKMEQHKKRMTQEHFKNFVGKIVDKQNWRNRWGKIKTFVQNNREALKQQLASNGGRDSVFEDQKNEVFNLILALYAGEDEEQVFADLDIAYKYHPREVEFYIPQLCTYLFHFNQDLPEMPSEQVIEFGNISKTDPEANAEHVVQSQASMTSNDGGNRALKNFLLQKSKESLRFSHLMFWCILASLDDTQSLQLSQHKNKEVWKVLNELVSSQDQARSATDDEFFKSIMHLQNSNQDAASKGEDDVIEEKKEEISDTGGSLSFNYSHSETLESHARMVRFDQQMMNALSFNAEEHQFFLSTPKFISDLLFVSEALKGIEKEERNPYLKTVLEELNRNLPANVYIPIQQESTNLPAVGKSIVKKSKKQRQQAKGSVGETQMHKVLRISEDYAFCLHSKERVPFHIIIEVAHDQDDQKSSDSRGEGEADYDADGLETQRPDRKKLTDDEGSSSKRKWSMENLKSMTKKRSQSRTAKKRGREQTEMMDISSSQKQKVKKSKSKYNSLGHNLDTEEANKDNQTKDSLASKLRKTTFFGENNNGDLTQGGNVTQPLHEQHFGQKASDENNDQLELDDIQIRERGHSVIGMQRLSNLQEQPSPTKHKKIHLSKTYESDMNNTDRYDPDASIAEAENQDFDMDESIMSLDDPIENQRSDAIAGYNIGSSGADIEAMGGKKQGINLGIEGEDEDGFSSDLQMDEEGKYSCFPNTARQLTSCLLGRYSELPVEHQTPQPAKKPKGLFGTKSFGQACREVQKKSPFKDVPGYGLISVIVKSPDNLTQEQFASQLIMKFQTIFQSHKLKLWLKPFNIIATCPTGGLIQTIPDAVSINQLKKQNPHIQTLRQYFIKTFKEAGIAPLGSQKGIMKTTHSLERKMVQKLDANIPPVNIRRYQAAKQNFMKSMAGYSLLCYILQIKDRHNGNILLDSRGHMIHVDFGFMLSNSPGNMNFEAHTFKLTQEYIDVLGGLRSKFFNQFKSLMVKGFMALREHAEEIISFVEMSIVSGIDLPCFQGRDRAIEELRERFKLDMSQTQCREHILKIIEEACDNWRTRWYDKFQRYSVGIW